MSDYLEQLSELAVDLAIQIDRLFSERCDSHDEECHNCKVWSAYDNLMEAMK